MVKICCLQLSFSIDNQLERVSREGGFLLTRKDVVVTLATTIRALSFFYRRVYSELEKMYALDGKIRVFFMLG